MIQTYIKNIVIDNEILCFYENSSIQLASEKKENADERHCI